MIRKSGKSMHRRKTLINAFRNELFIILSYLLISFPISTARGADVLTCGLNECMRYASENRSDARAAKLDVDVANLNITIEESKFLPDIDAETDLGYFDGNATTPFAVVGDRSDEGIPRSERSDPYYSARLSLDIPLFIEGTISRKNAPSVKKKGYERSYKMALRETIESEIMYEVSEAYYHLLQQMREVEIQELNVRLKRLSYETMEAKSVEGLIPKTDLINARMDLLSAEKDFDISRNELTLRKMDLIKSIGGPLDLEIEISDQPGNVPELPDVDILIKKAFSQRNDLTSNKALLEMERESEEFYNRSNYPSASLMANYSLADNFEAPVNDSWNIFMKVNLPIFDGGFNKRNASLSEIKARMINERIDGLYHQISQEIWHDYYEVKNLQTEFVMREKEIELLEEKLAVIREKARENLLPKVALDEEEIKLEIARKRNLQLKYKLHDAMDRLNKVVGDIPHVFP